MQTAGVRHEIECHVRIYVPWSRSRSGDEEAHLRDIKGREIRGLSWRNYIDKEERGGVSNKFKIAILAHWVNGSFLIVAQIFHTHQISMFVPVLTIPLAVK